MLIETLGRDSCSSLVFHTQEAGASSIVSEWGLVCDMNYKSKVKLRSDIAHLDPVARSYNLQGTAGMPGGT